MSLLVEITWLWRFPECVPYFEDQFLPQFRFPQDQIWYPRFFMVNAASSSALYEEYLFFLISNIFEVTELWL